MATQKGKPNVIIQTKNKLNYFSSPVHSEKNLDCRNLTNIFSLVLCTNYFIKSLIVMYFCFFKSPPFKANLTYFWKKCFLLLHLTIIPADYSFVLLVKIFVLKTGYHYQLFHFWITFKKHHTLWNKIYSFFFYFTTSVVEDK